MMSTRSPWVAPIMTWFRYSLRWALPAFVVAHGVSARADIDGFGESCGAYSGCFEVSGAITQADVDRAKYLLQYRKTPTVFLDSPGGSLSAALQIGAIMRQSRAIGVVLPGKTCVSSCVFLLAGASWRVVGGRVGIHRPFTLETGQLSPTMVQARHRAVETYTKRYLNYMNVPTSLYDAMVRVAPENMKFLSKNELRFYGLDARDPTDEEVDDSANAQRYGLNKFEYFAKKRVFEQECLPGMRKTGDVSAYDRCVARVMKGESPTQKEPVAQNMGIAGDRQPLNVSQDPEISSAENDYLTQARRYYNGKGVEKNLQEAARLYRLAAEQGNPVGQASLGYLYYDGEGVERNFQEAARWFRLAAMQGNAKAQATLSGLYKRGEGVPQSPEQADLWCQQAVKKGVDSCLKN